MIKINNLLCATLILLFLSMAQLIAKQDLTKLLEEQAANPTDPIVNYNLGVVQYLDKKYVTAAPNFIRAVEHGSRNKKLVQQAQFNVAKCLERGALATLPKNWEKRETDIEDKVLDTAIASVQQACTWYKKDPADIKMQKNLVLAEDLLKKLLAKKKQQQQKQDKDKNKDQQKDDKSGGQQDQQKDGQAGDQDKQSGDKSGDQKQQPGGKSGDQKDDKSGNQSGPQDQVKDKRDNEQKDNKKAGGQKGPEAPSHPSKEGDNQQSEGKEAKDNEQQQQNGVDHAQDSGKEQTSSDGTQPDDKKQASLQDRRMQAVLENLQADESKQQKALLSKQLKQSGQQQTPNVNQKPW